MAKSQNKAASSASRRRTSSKPKAASSAARGVSTSTAAWFSGAIEKINGATDWEELHALCAAYAKRIGFDSFLYAFELPCADGRSSSVVISNYPDAWLAQYSARNYVASDAVVAKGMVDLLPFDWSELIFSSEASRLVALDAMSYGLVSGFTVPVPPTRSAFGASGLLNFASSKKRALRGTQREAILSQALLFAFHGMKAAARIAEEARARYFQKPPALTPQQLTALQLVAGGSTDEGIARELRISHSATAKLVDSVANRLGASSREGAVIRASLFGLLGWSRGPT